MGTRVEVKLNLDTGSTNKIKWILLSSNIHTRDSFSIIPYDWFTPSELKVDYLITNGSFFQLLLVWQESTTVVASKMKDNIVNYAILHTYFEIIFIHMFGSTLESFILSPQGKCIFFFFLLPYSKLFHTDRSKAGNMLIHYKNPVQMITTIKHTP